MRTIEAYTTDTDKKTTDFYGKSIETQSKKKIKIVDLFCGCGGFTAGVIEAILKNNFDAEVSFAVDYDSDAMNVFKLNFGKYIRKLQTTDIGQIFSGELGSPYTVAEKKLGIDRKSVVVGKECRL